MINRNLIGKEKKIQKQFCISKFNYLSVVVVVKICHIDRFLL